MRVWQNFLGRAAIATLCAIKAVSLMGCETTPGGAMALALLPARAIRRAPPPAGPGAHVFQVVGSGPIFLLGRDRATPVVLQVGLVGVEGRYRDDRRITGEGEYQLHSEVFDMEELRRGARSSFKAALFRGRVEDGVRIAQGVAIQVERVLYYKSGPPGPDIVGGRPWLFLFGSRNEMFSLFLDPAPERRLLLVRVRRGPLTDGEASALRHGALATLLEESGRQLQANVQPGNDAYRLDLEILMELTPR
jgi:hypothetical protein